MMSNVFFFLCSTSNAAMKIQFFGLKQDSNRVRDAIYKMVERGRVNNITLIPSSLTFHDEAVLQIEVRIVIHALIKFILIDRNQWMRRFYYAYWNISFWVCIYR